MGKENGARARTICSGKERRKCVVLEISSEREKNGTGEKRALSLSSSIRGGARCRNSKDEPTIRFRHPSAPVPLELQEVAVCRCIRARVPTIASLRLAIKPIFTVILCLFYLITFYFIRCRSIVKPTS
ncbi:hypothetical protein PUN28_004943 [Cardiocondyla obscurior]|uniref:Transmembrane protein n=1 Tax=Cardiocondyla obscurior TaxID=286306 RepID=A0AAW2GFZ7_9HYME